MLRFLRLQTVRWLVLLVVIEQSLLALSMNAAVYLRFAGTPDAVVGVGHNQFLRSMVFASVITLAMAALGQYQAHLRVSWFGVLARQAVAFFIGALSLSITYYLLPQIYVGRGVVGMALALGFVSVVIFRALFLRLVEVEALKRRVLILGAGNRALQLHNLVRRRSDRRGFTLVGFLPARGEPMMLPSGRVFEVAESLPDLVIREQVDEIVVSVDDRRGGLPMDDLLECRQLGVTITDLTTFFERESGRVQLGMVEPSWLVFSSGFDATPLRRATKRCFDLGFALLMLALTWPLMLLVALAIMIESGPRQPIFYRQERVGVRRKTFWVLKFRSMRTDAELDGVARWASAGDTRVTRVGRVCRSWRLDELPQLLNVLRGEMSIVGPRPERPQFVADLATKIRYYDLRHCLKPGLAGWAQLRFPYGASESDAAEKLKYDLFYVKNHNLLFDLMILIQTVEVVIFGRGAR